MLKKIIPRISLVDIKPKKTWVLGLGLESGPRLKPKPKVQRDPDSEFYILVYKSTKKKFFLGSKNLLGIKKIRKTQTIFLRSFKIF